ncbi:MAG: phosphatase PAP2 family protein [Bacteroidetes bacterium]|nr:phosphatase PAP2 family protein [Bacteroidota bacterium]MBK9483203.1 phosphatase PAP2 family protein [Bacteroidota bacterium]
MKPIIHKIVQKNALFLSAFAVWFVLSCAFMYLFTDKALFFAINQFHHPFFDHVMTVLSAYGRGDSITIVFVILLVFPIFRNKEYLFTTILFGIILPVISYISKDFFDKARPIGMYNIENVHAVPWLENLYNDSFPSGHTMGAFGFFFLLNHFLPQKNNTYTLFFFLLALGCGYSRIYLGQHFYSDVVAGSFIGVFVSFLILLMVNFFTQNKTTHV